MFGDLCKTGTMSLALVCSQGAANRESREIPGSLWRSPEPVPNLREPAGACMSIAALEILQLLRAVRTPERVDAEGKERRKERRRINLCHSTHKAAFAPGSRQL